jgi:protein SCO1/2
MDRHFGEIARGLAASDPQAAEGVRLLSISFDPEHDTPETLRRHAARVGAEPPLWTLAVAPHDELRKVAEDLGLTYGPTGDEIRHTLSTAVIDPEGRLARLWTGSDWSTLDVRRVVHDLRRGGSAAEGAGASK